MCALTCQHKMSGTETRTSSGRFSRRCTGPVMCHIRAGDRDFVEVQRSMIQPSVIFNVSRKLFVVDYVDDFLFVGHGENCKWLSEVWVRSST